MALAISAVILAVGVWFHRVRDRPVFAESSTDIFSRSWAIAYLLVVATGWTSSAALSVVRLATGRSEFETQNPAIVLPGLVVLAAAVLTILRTARAIDAYDHELGGPVGQLGRFLRVGYGTSAVAAFRVMTGKPYL